MPSLKSFCSCFHSCLCLSAPDPTPPHERPRPAKPPAVVFELLLLGADGSGKSTFIRQMQIIHGQGFNDEERAELIPDIQRNILEAMTVLVQQMQPNNLNIGLREERWADRDTLLSEQLSIQDRLATVGRLWEDPGVRECYDRRAEYSTNHPLNVSTKYFLDANERVADTRYLPITEDIIRVRKSTIGVIQYEFVLDDIQFKIIDVGGEREERVRWIDFLAGRITCVIFLAAVDEYDTYFLTAGGETRNRLTESVELFSQIQHHQWLAHTTFILFLNKVDVFRDKLQTSHMKDHFDEFTG